MQLVIGNKRYSSWSLRPWLLMTHFSIPFDELLIPLDTDDTKPTILKFGAGRTVPILIDDDLVIWESLAIAEYLQEKFPELPMWPRDLQKRAKARSLSCEMATGFFALREHLSHDLHKHKVEFDREKSSSDIERIFQIWRHQLERSGGPFLFGDFGTVDAMYAPVVNRFLSYAVQVPDDLQLYLMAVRNLRAHQEWIKAAELEQLRVPRYE